MLTVETDPVAVEQRLGSGGLACPGCSGVLAGWGVRCQNSATGSDQRFQAAASYWLIKPLRIGRRRIPPRIGSGTGASARGGRNFSDRCGRRPL